MLAFVFADFVFNSFCCLSANVFSSHFSASLCFCYPSFCLLCHFVIQYLLTCLLVFSNYFDFSFFIFVNIYTYYGLVDCMTCADALLDLVVCVPSSDLYLFRTEIGMRSSLIIVCINSVFPFISFPFSVGLALTGFLWYIFMILCVVIKSLRLFEPCPFLVL